MTGDDYKRTRTEDLGMSQRELAGVMGVTPRTIINREQGKKLTREAAIAIRAVAKEKKSTNPNRTR